MMAKNIFKVEKYVALIWQKKLFFFQVCQDLYKKHPRNANSKCISNYDRKVSSYSVFKKHEYLAIVENIFKITAQTSSKHRLHRLLISFTGWAT